MWGFRSCGILCRVQCSTVTDVQKARIVIIFRLKRSLLLPAPAEILNLQQHGCDKRRYRKPQSYFYMFIIAQLCPEFVTK